MTPPQTWHPAAGPRPAPDDCNRKRSASPPRSGRRPQVAAWLRTVDPQSTAALVLLNELLAEFVERSRLDDAAALLRLVEDLASEAAGWRRHARLLADLADAMCVEKYGGRLAYRCYKRKQPDWAFLGLTQ